MSGYGFDKKEIPSWCVDVDNDIYFEDNQAQLIIDAYEAGLFASEHNNPLYLGFCIIVVADPDNPANLSYSLPSVRLGSEQKNGSIRKTEK